MAFKKYSYQFTEIAEADIDDIMEYISRDLANPDAATAFADELEFQLGEICKVPTTGKLVENEYLARKDVRRFLVKNYIAYYIIDNDQNNVVILRVVYGKRNQDKIASDF